MAIGETNSYPKELFLSKTAYDALVAMGALPNYLAVSGDTTTLALEDNTEYVFHDPVTSLELTYPGDKFDCWMSFATGEDTITITFPQGTSFIGSVPEFEPGKTYEVSIRNKVAVVAEVVAE